MNRARNWTDRYLSLAVEQGQDEFVNCWSFVRKVLFSEFGVLVPAYSPGSEKELHELVEREKFSGQWIGVSVAKEGDLVLFRSGASKLHIGIMVDEARVLHYKNNQTGAVVELIRGLTLVNRIEGYFRHAG
jgi:cell wall-associated NlpC family hydrolase